MSSSPEEKIAALIRGPMCQDCGGHLSERESGTVCMNQGCEVFGKLILAKAIGTPAPTFGPRPWAPGEIIPRHLALLNLIEGHVRRLTREGVEAGNPASAQRVQNQSTTALRDLDELRGILKRQPPPPPDVPAELAESRRRERRNLYRAAWTIVLLGSLALIAIARLL